MSTSSGTTTTRGTTSSKRLVYAGIIAAIATAIANVLVRFLVPTMFRFSLDIPVQGPGSAVQPLPVFMVIAASVLPAVGATMLFALLNRFTTHPVAIFRTIAVVFLLLSFGAPFSLPVALNVQLTLAAMHVIAAVVITYVLTTQAAERFVWRVTTSSLSGQTRDRNRIVERSS